jgi:uncharacterized protein YrrD
MTDNQAPEDLGSPVSYLVFKDGTPVYEQSGDRIGEVEHVLADEPEDVFHGLVIKTRGGHRFAPADKVAGLYEHGAVLTVPAAGLPTPSEDATGDRLQHSLKRAWEWLIRPR